MLINRFRCTDGAGPGSEKGGWLAAGKHRIVEGAKDVWREVVVLHRWLLNRQFCRCWKRFLMMGGDNWRKFDILQRVKSVPQPPQTLHLPNRIKPGLSGSGSCLYYTVSLTAVQASCLCAK